jgi:hypothetical protein
MRTAARPADRPGPPARGQSRRLNPRALLVPDTGSTLRADLDAPEHTTVAVRSMFRSILDAVRDDPTPDTGQSADLRLVFAALDTLREARDGIDDLHLIDPGNPPTAGNSATPSCRPCNASFGTSTCRRQSRLSTGHGADPPRRPPRDQNHHPPPPAPAPPLRFRRRPAASRGSAAVTGSPCRHSECSPGLPSGHVITPPGGCPGNGRCPDSDVVSGSRTDRGWWWWWPARHGAVFAPLRVS